MNCNVAKYYASLAEGLDKLERAATTDFMTYEFVVLAMDIVTTALSGLVLLIQKAGLPAFRSGEEFVNHYIDETAKSLTVSNVLKTAVSELCHYQKLVKAVIRALEDPENRLYGVHHGLRILDACEREMVVIARENNMLVESKTGGAGQLQALTVKPERAECDWLPGAICALKTTNSYISGVLLCAVVSGARTPKLNAELLAVKSPWSASLVRLHQRLTEEAVKTHGVRKCPAMFSREMELLEGALADLRAQLEPLERGSRFGIYDTVKLKQTVRILRKGLRMLQLGVLEAVNLRNDELFDEIVDGRNIMLSGCKFWRGSCRS